MARIINELTGRATGKVGQQIYRIRDGKTSLCALPASFTVSQSAKAVEGRSRFGLAIKVTKAMGKLSQLKYIWKHTSLTSGDEYRSPYNKMMKEIYPYVFKEDLDVVMPIVPGLGFIAEKSSITLASDEITAVINAIGNAQGIDPLVETSFQLACIVYCKSPLDDRKAPFDFIWCLSEAIPVNLIASQTFSIALAGMKTTLFGLYSTHKAYFTLMTLDADGVPVRFSDTFTS